MFQLAEPNAIGSHLKDLIKERYKNPRQFCIAYLKLQGGSINDEEIRKLSNRFFQILKGTKRIQVDDLPFVSKLLDISCEEILSAGQCLKPTSNHVTNYSIALSDNQEEWDNYIEREDKLVLNYDEYGKSVLDYAYEFKNYPLLKYMFQKGYIRFKDAAESGFQNGYGAETTIKHREIFDTDILESRIARDDNLRLNIITLALENQDFDILESLYARETPMMHFAAIYDSNPQMTEHYDCSRLVTGISAAPDKVIDYFSKEYSIISPSDKIESFFIFQHLDEVIKLMIQGKNKHVLSVIKAATAHNQKVSGSIQSLIQIAVQNIIKQFNCSKEVAKSRVVQFSSFHDNCNVLKYHCIDAKKAIASNIIRCDIDSADLDIHFALEGLNSSFDLVKTYLERNR